MFGITSAASFFQKARANYKRVEADISDAGVALDCILTLYHLHEWVWALWLKDRRDVRNKLGLKNGKSDFLVWLDVNCPHFQLVQELANGTKHCSPVHPTRKVAGFGVGPFGVGPFGKPYLLIDLGDASEPAQRYLVASNVMKDNLAFWETFVEEHGIVDENRPD